MRQVETANEALARAMNDAAATLLAGMKASNLTRIRLNGQVAFVGEEGDFHDEYIAVAIDHAGALVAEDSGGNETDWDSVSCDNQHSILCLLEGSKALSVTAA